MADLDTVTGNKRLSPRKQCTTGEIKEEILKVSARLDEAEGRIENTEVAMIEKNKATGEGCNNPYCVIAPLGGVALLL